jgi:hypothetical protein
MNISEIDQLINQTEFENQRLRLENKIYKQIVAQIGDKIDTLKSITPEILTTKERNLESQSENFTNWLDNRIEQNDNSVLKLSDVCFAYLGKNHGPRVLTK